MRAFITSLKGLKNNRRWCFAGWVMVFYILLMVLFIYLMMANLSGAPQFIYEQF